MGLLILKFGGTSVANVDYISKVANIVSDCHKKGNKIIVVVSAMAGDTNRLESLAKGVSSLPNSRELDMLLASGEQVTISLLAMSLIDKGIQARSMLGSQVPILTNAVHNKARIQSINAEMLHGHLNSGEVVIIAGFQGITPDGEITTLGRGGSDTTAVAIAAALKADECRIYTDVDGVYTTDPKLVPTARRMNKVTFEEMLELSSLGAKVLQIRAVELAGRYSVPLRVLSTFTSDSNGTLITYEDKAMEEQVVAGIAFSRDEAKVVIRGVPDTPGFAGKILQSISHAHIEVDMIIQNVSMDGTTDFTFTVHSDDLEKTRVIVEGIAKELKVASVSTNDKIAKLSLVGVGMRSHSGIASRMFVALGQEGVNIQLISTSEIKISVLIDEKYLELGVRALHEEFKLSEDSSLKAVS
ncbi:MAG: aspartate kinase [Francisellaceae bacterium]|jgi:aspartate kinase|nr:aspartate kinase [Francisellaceae bacterium]MBT6206997.1 aspartate kinase [Francisellaceae bacterium]MBT6539432.1 aspartate kinase [Francisellaceae bacterium]